MKNQKTANKATAGKATAGSAGKAAQANKPQAGKAGPQAGPQAVEVSHPIAGATFRHILTRPRSVANQNRWTRNALTAQGAIRVSLNGRYIEVSRGVHPDEAGNVPETFNDKPLRIPADMLEGTKRIARIDCSAIKTSADIYDLVHAVIVGAVGSSVCWNDGEATKQATAGAAGKAKGLQDNIGTALIAMLNMGASNKALQATYLAPIDGDDNALVLTAKQARSDGLELFDRLETALNDLERNEAFKTTIETIRAVFAQPQATAGNRLQAIDLGTLWDDAAAQASAEPQAGSAGG